MTVDFYTQIEEQSVVFSVRQKSGLFRKGSIVPVANWSGVLPDAAWTLVDRLVDEYDGIKDSNAITLPHGAITGLTEAQASMLGLPPSIPFAFDIRTNGMIDHPDFSLSTSWVTAGGMRELITRKGAFVLKGHSTYRIPSPVYEIVNAAELLSSKTNDNELRMKALATLQDVISREEGTENRVRVDGFLGSIRVLHASSFSLQIPTDGESFQFNPVLFSKKAIARAQDGGRNLEESESLLTPKLQQTFAQGRFKRWDVVRDCYAVDDGVYVYVDPDLKKALGVVRTMQKSTPAERRAFIHSPQRIIKEQLGEDIAADAVELLFVETEQYAQNVVDIGVWSPPVIPWLVKEPNTWLPEKFGLKIGDSYVQIKPEDVGVVRQEVTNRFHASDLPQEPYIYDGEDGPVSIPITKESVTVLQNLSGYADAVQAADKKALTPKQEEDLKVKAGPFFLLVEDNVDEVRYQIAPSRRAEAADYRQPVVLKSELKSHQVEGFKWLIDAWTQGAPGVLLADDMGLGKTLQALTFLAWIQERKHEGHTKCREPLLIVAPTGLLNNWQKEVATHLYEVGLGKICKAYGGNLSAVRYGDQNDLDVGRGNLNRDSLRSHDVVLTTYETYRDYHHSFGGIRFSAAVLDECQKIKNPKSQVNRALASMNAEFVITMTGTPIENAMEDLWTILDRAWPGFLGNLKSFSSTYSPDNKQALSALTEKIKGPAAAGVSAPILWRRMKEDIASDLPKKHCHPSVRNGSSQWWQEDEMVVTMPPKQADAYNQVVQRAREQEPPPMLMTLHSLRSISLHPIDPAIVLREGNAASYDAYINESARLKKAIEILDVVRRKQEKALMFIETVDMQSLMAVILKKRYGLSKQPGIINGKTGVDKIQKLVDAFQDDPNFDVMILSPKVGGVGLTLTAANHVIHLSRWWNPAVEDQSTDRVYRIGQKKDVHVYCPIAVHPDTHIRESSFDLRLNALLERKRTLSRDMLIPAEDPNDTKTLFEETVGSSTAVDGITIEELDYMSWESFEHWVLNTAGCGGYVADKTQRSWDGGADGIITHKETGQKFILQCKHSGRDKIAEHQVIEDLLRARESYDSDAGLIALTNAQFSRAVKQKMNQLGIRFFDRETICTWPRNI